MKSRIEKIDFLNRALVRSLSRAKTGHEKQQARAEYEIAVSAVNSVKQAMKKPKGSKS